MQLEAGELRYALYLGLILFPLFIVCRRFRDWPLVYLSVLGAYALAATIAAFMSPFQTLFGVIRYLCIGIFVGAPLLLLYMTYCLRQSGKPRWALACLGSMFFLNIVALDAFVLEPHDLQIRHEKIRTAKLKRPLRLLVMSDIQTDTVGDYEDSVLARAMREKPDLILLPGDYVQTHPTHYIEQTDKLRALLLKHDFSAPLGAYAVGGDADYQDYSRIFRGTKVRVFTKTERLELPELTITALNLADSRSGKAVYADSEKYHIVFGHAPDYSRSNPPGDLYLAGHTHGGQIQIPGFGPLMTLSLAERSACGGCCKPNPTGGDAMLMITRGVGMERFEAPRLRFFCKPEFVVIDVEPMS